MLWLGCGLLLADVDDTPDSPVNRPLPGSPRVFCRRMLPRTADRRQLEGDQRHAYGNPDKCRLIGVTLRASVPPMVRFGQGIPSVTCLPERDIPRLIELFETGVPGTGVSTMAASLLSRLTSSLGDERLQLNPAAEDTAEKMTNDAARIRIW